MNLLRSAPRYHYPRGEARCPKLLAVADAAIVVVVSLPAVAAAAVVVKGVTGCTI